MTAPLPLYLSAACFPTALPGRSGFLFYNKIIYQPRSADIDGDGTHYGPFDDAQRPDGSGMHDRRVIDARKRFGLDMPANGGDHRLWRGLTSFYKQTPRL